jgi:hypothetical protein
VTEHIKTRSTNQVRSHLQKHQLKEKRMKDKNNNYITNNKDEKKIDVKIEENLEKLI